MNQSVKIGTRKSELAVVQTRLVADRMKKETPGVEAELVLKQTVGDKILDKPLLAFGGKGVFVSEFEEALQRGELDFAVHSGKDLPMALADGLEIVGIPKRGDVRDVLVSRTDGELERKALCGETIVVGTSSLRRQIQMEIIGPKRWNGTAVKCENLRGNVQSRLKKLAEGQYDVIVLAAAGLQRLEILTKDESDQEATALSEDGGFRFTYLNWEEMIPAGCQGILAVEGRKGNPVNEIAEKITDRETALCFRLERRVLKLLNAGCHEPIGVCGRIFGEELMVRGIYQEGDSVPVYADWKGSINDWEQAANQVAEMLKGYKGNNGEQKTAETRGCVILAGAGPGDPGLITVKSVEALRSCDAVVYDSLASEDFLKEVKPECEKIYVGKRAGHHSMKQEEINRILVEQAKIGRRVVRLKGGDPFVFGRGGEEILELQKEGIPYEVIPGVTSAVAALASAGIPITHRGMSRSFHVMTGHTRENGLPEDLEQFGRLSGTLVFLMGLSHVKEICESLIAQGRLPETPAAVIQSGTLPQQKVVRGTLTDIHEKCKEAGIASPAIIAVGDVTALRMESTLKKPLEGIKVGITGTPAFAGKLEAALKEQGAQTESMAVLEVISHADSKQVEACLEKLEQYSWVVFTSANGVRIFLKALMESGRDYRSLGHVKLAAVGKGTDRELRRHGLRADYIPERYCAEDLARGLASLLGAEDKALIPRAARGSAELPRILREAGISYDDVVLYDVKGIRLQGAALEDRLEALDYLTFASASGVEAFLENLPVEQRQVLKSLRLVSIGEATAAAMREAGYPADLEAEEFSAAGIVNCILEDADAR